MHFGEGKEIELHSALICLALIIKQHRTWHAYLESGAKRQ